MSQAPAVEASQKAADDQAAYEQTNQYIMTLYPNDASKAVIVWQNFLIKNPGLSTAKFALIDIAYFCYSLGKFNEAARTFQNVMKAYPDQGEAINALRCLYIKFPPYLETYQTYNGNDGIVERLKEIASYECPNYLREDRARFLYRSGVFFKKNRGDRQKSIEYFRKAVSEHPGTIWAKASQADIEWSSGNEDRSVGLFREALNKDLSSFCEEVELPEKMISRLINSVKEKGVEIMFDGDENAKQEQKYTIACAALAAPSLFFEGLKKITFDDIKSDMISFSVIEGTYHPFLRKIGLNYNSDARSQNVSELIHELMHHWDFCNGSDKRQVGINKFINLLANDLDFHVPNKYNLSAVYSAISWNGLAPRWVVPFNLYPVIYSLSTNKPADFACHPHAGLFNNDRIRYGMANKREDFATFGASYFCDNVLRSYSRVQMKNGNFAPALKYLYFRFLTPLAGQEFGISKEEQSLGFDEVNNTMSAWLKSHHDQATLSNANTLLKIKELSEEMNSIRKCAKPKGSQL